MTDATRRKLTIPHRYIPYLEKHNIYELFHELACQLVIQMPQDHVRFLKEVLFNALRSRNAPRIILMAPPQVNKIEVAKQLASLSGITVITDEMIAATNTSISGDNQDLENNLSVTMLKLSKLLHSPAVYSSGWVLVDFPSNELEARSMQRAGILPTHVIHLVPPFSPPLDILDGTDAPAGWQEYRRNLLGLKNAYHHIMREIFLGDSDLEDVVIKCNELIKIRTAPGVPILPRILILGPRGSGRRTQAKKLKQKFNLVHIDFAYLLYQTYISESHLGTLLRENTYSLEDNSVLVSAIINKRLLERDCINQGWVLTGYPNTIEDFKELDALDTPPNRIVFLECEKNTCLDRVCSRRVNMFSGSVINLLETPSKALLCRHKMHPKDHRDAVSLEINYYEEHFEDMRNYCGKRARVLSADQPVRWIFEMICAMVTQLAPSSSPRSELLIEMEKKKAHLMGRSDSTQHSHRPNAPAKIP